MTGKKANIHGVIIYTKNPNYRNQFNQYIASARSKDNYKDFYDKTDFIFCKKLSEIAPLKRKYSYTLLIIDLLSYKEPVSELAEYLSSFPGYHDVSYKHFTYIRTKDINSNLRKLLREVPVCLVAENADISMQQVNLGLTLLAEVYGAKICHPALMKFFELYQKGDYRSAFELARIFHERYPQREILFVLLQSASLSLEYVNEKTIAGEEVVSIFTPKSKLGLFNYKNELIAARNLFKKGKSKEGRDEFKKILTTIGGYKKGSIINVLLWLMEKFVTVTGYTCEENDINQLSGCIDLVKELEPSLAEKNLKFKNITMTDINKSVYNCRLGAEMAILSNVIAFYCSHVKDYEMASKLYGAAYCFAYNNIDLKLPTLRNMRKTYQKLGNMKNVNLVEKEIQRIEVLNVRENDTNIIPIKKAG